MDCQQGEGIFYESPNPVNNKSLIIFIHGFLGNASGTWRDTPQLLMQDSHFDDSDFFFYQYKAERTPIRISSRFFMEKIEELIDKYEGNSTNKYKKILIVAHSMGAVVARWAIIDAISQEKKWKERVNFTFFAPAHCGARPDEVFQLIYSIATKISFRSIVFPTIDELSADSILLRRLKSECENEKNVNLANLVTESIFHAEKESVVFVNDFMDSENFTCITEKDHITIVKATKRYLDPIEIIKELI